MDSIFHVNPYLGAICFLGIVLLISTTCNERNGSTSADKLPLGVNCCWVDGYKNGTVACIPSSTHQGTLGASARMALGIKINVNHANVEDLQLVTGVGPKLAQRIIHTRERAGHFTKLNDLETVPGIGPRTKDKASSFLAIADPHCHRMMLGY